MTCQIPNGCINDEKANACPLCDEDGVDRIADYYADNPLRLRKEEPRREEMPLRGDAPERREVPPASLCDRCGKLPAKEEGPCSHVSGELPDEWTICNCCEECRANCRNAQP